MKVMAHMDHPYLTENQMPCTYWFFAITHAACMMNAIPGKIHGHLASPFLLVHGIGHTKCTWILLLLCVSFITIRMVLPNNPSTKHILWMALSLAGLLRLMRSLCTILKTSNITNQTLTVLILITSWAWSTRMSNMIASFSVLYFGMIILQWRRNTPRDSCWKSGSYNQHALYWYSHGYTLLFECLWLFP